MNVLIVGSNASTQTITQSDTIPASQRIPNEVLTRIFSFLDPKDIGRAAQVNRQWKQIAYSDLVWETLEKTRLTSAIVTILDQTVWEKCVNLAALGLELKNPYPLPIQARVIPLFEIPREPQKTLTERMLNENGLTFLTIPKGLTLNKLFQLVKAPKAGNPLNVNVLQHALNGFEDVAIPKTYHIVITNSILRESDRPRRMGPDELVAEQKELAKNGCQLPTILEATAFLALTYLNSLAPPLTQLNPVLKEVGYSRRTGKAGTICMEEIPDASIPRFVNDTLHGTHINLTVRFDIENGLFISYLRNTGVIGESPFYAGPGSNLYVGPYLGVTKTTTLEEPQPSSLKTSIPIPQRPPRHRALVSRLRDRFF